MTPNQLTSSFDSSLGHPWQIGTAGVLSLVELGSWWTRKLGIGPQKRLLGMLPHRKNSGPCLEALIWAKRGPHRPSRLSCAKIGCGFILGCFLFFLICFFSFFVRASKMSYFTALSREIDAFYTSPSASPASFSTSPACPTNVPAKTGWALIIFNS